MIKQLDLFNELDKSVYEALGANEHGVFCSFDCPIDVKLKNRSSARALIAFDGKYWHIATEIWLSCEGSGSYPSVQDKWSSYDQAYNRARRKLLVALGRVSKRSRDNYGAKKDAAQLLRMIK